MNLAGADFGETNLPGTFNVDYTYPAASEVEYFVAKGMNTFRVPFRWERLQRSLFAELDATELSRLQTLVSAITDRGARAILDPHNYSRYQGEIIGADDSGVTSAAFDDFWSRLAQAFESPLVVYGLMNEPHTMSTELWLSNANAAIAAIRETGAENLILVPGNAWTGAHSWSQSWYGTANATVMENIVDPADNFAFDMHQYLDADKSGTSPECESTTTGSQSLVDATNWLRARELRAFLGEFGGGDNATCAAALTDILAYMNTHKDVWLGWSFWAAGPWWGDSWYYIGPKESGDDPRLAILMNAVDGGASATSSAAER